MTSTINTSQTPVLLNTAQKPNGRSGVADIGAQPSQGRGTEAQLDKVSMTSEASRLQKIEEQLSTVPAVDNARVAEIKAAIANGSFTIDPQAIAAKLIAFEGSK
jgi:negative regulator of flagellin synthesis FlgM